MKLASMERMKPMATGPDFPWGLNLNLGDAELKKVNITELPQIGDEYTIVAIAKVTRVSANASEDDSNRSVEFQITDMALEEGDEAEGEDGDGDAGTQGVAAIAEKLYPKQKKA
jgi:hypothetical protein